MCVYRCAGSGLLACASARLVEWLAILGNARAHVCYAPHRDFPAGITHFCSNSIDQAGDLPESDVFLLTNALARKDSRDDLRMYHAR